MSRQQSLSTLLVGVGLLAVVILVASMLSVPSATPRTDPTGSIGTTTLLHIGGYGTLAAGSVAVATRCAQQTHRSRLTAVFAAIAAVSLFGVSTELLQAMVPWRSAAVAEMVLNTASAAAGGLLATMWFSLTGVYPRQ